MGKEIVRQDLSIKRQLHDSAFDIMRGRNLVAKVYIDGVHHRAGVANAKYDAVISVRVGDKWEAVYQTLTDGATKQDALYAYQRAKALGRTKKGGHNA